MRARDMNVPIIANKYSYLIFSRPEAASDVISGDFARQSITDKAVKFGDPGLNDISVGFTKGRFSPLFLPLEAIATKAVFASYTGRAGGRTEMPLESAK